jgi:hypothetical protein
MRENSSETASEARPLLNKNPANATEGRTNRLFYSIQEVGRRDKCDYCSETRINFI